MVDLVLSAQGGPGRRYLTFRVDQRLYALPAEEVSEVIRIPPVAKVPQSPRGLLGVANLRGAVLPVASLRALLGHADGGDGASARAIVLDGAAPVAVAVDAVEALVTLDAGKVETRQAELAAEPGEALRGAFQASAGADVAKILDLQALLAASFSPRPRSEAARGRSLAGAIQGAAQAEDKREVLVTFEVAGQEYALPLSDVQEIVNAPQTLAAVPRAEALVLGVTAFRDALLPLLSLRGLLGFAPAPMDGREKVVVMAIGGVLVGLVADRMRSILRAEAALVEPTPAVLAARAGGETRIKAIYRGEGGRRLVSILDPALLFREDVMQRLQAGAGASDLEASGPQTAADEEFQVLVFRLGDEEFGLPIAAVDEVARTPDKITRLPKTPKFLEGVVNLRGEVLPVIDQRRRFDMPPLQDADSRRLVVVRTGKRKAGVIVDSVSEVLRARQADVEPAPDLAGESERLVNGVLNQEARGRMILLLDPAELLSRSEQKLLEAFERGAGPAAS
jgi:purine-binding chemotaxis protein CheW